MHHSLTKPLKTKRDAPAHFEDKGDDLFRVGGLSDALFAIVLTLLVLELKLPESTGAMSDGDLYRYLVALWPKLLSFLLTFLVTGVYWVAHHWDFAHIARYDRRLLWLNLSFLLCVSFLPFSTALLGSHIGALTWRLYALNMVLTGVTLTAVWGYAMSQELVSVETSPKLARYALIKGLTPPAVFLLSLLATFVSVDVAYLLPLAIAPLQPLVHRLYFGTRADHGGRKHPFQTVLWRLLGWSPLLVFALWSVWTLVKLS